jgi:heme-degrading monooxygenase HmoA
MSDSRSMVDCYAVIFSSQRTADDAPGYSEMADAMERLAREQPGFLAIESARGADGFGITVSYWESLAAIDAWRNQAQHLVAQRLGIEKWYANYQLRIARVVRESPPRH